MRAVRLAFAMQRFELRLLLGAVALLVVASLAIAWQTRALREEQLACFRAAPPAVEGSTGSPCGEQDPALRFLETAGAFAKAGITATPFVLGIFLGVPLVAREVEGRTAPIAWSLSRSRRRWLLLRATPVVATVGMAALLAGIGGEILSRSAPWAEGTDLGFTDYGARGGLVAVRGVAVVAIAMAIGSLVPRQLPAVLLSGGAVLALFVAWTIVMDGWMADEAQPVAHTYQTAAQSKIFNMGYRDDLTGQVLTFDEYYQHYGDAGLNELGEPAGMSPVYWVVPGARYGDFVLRESAVLGGATLLALGTAAAVVGRRRP